MSTLGADFVIDDRSRCLLAMAIALGEAVDWWDSSGMHHYLQLPKLQELAGAFEGFTKAVYSWRSELSSKVDGVVTVKELAAQMSAGVFGGD